MTSPVRQEALKREFPPERRLQHQAKGRDPLIEHRPGGQPRDGNPAVTAASVPYRGALTMLPGGTPARLC
jgi:hypothetical protein